MKINNVKYFLLAGCVFLYACKVKEDVDPDETGGSNLALTPDWTEATHSKNADPNYDVVFPQDKVNTLEITMTTTDWENIQADMLTKAGFAFGSGAGTSTMPGGGGQAGGGGTIPTDSTFTGGGVPGGTPPTGGGAAGGGAAAGGGNAGGGALDIISGDPIYVATSVKFNGKEWYHVGFRLKGNSSLSGAWREGIYKLPFKLNFDEFEDDYPEIKNQRFYGFKEFSMSPGYDDNSLMRDKLASDLFRNAGVPAAKTAFYKIYINFGSGLKYCGVYTMVEVIDDTMVENQFGEDNGNIYKPESTFQSFTQSEFEKKNNETEANWSDVQSIITYLNASTRTSNATQWRSNLESVFNVDHFVKVQAVNNVIVNWDAYGSMAHNYYLYNHSSKKMMWIPWDFNLSMTASSNSTQVGGGASMRGVSLSMSEVTSSWPLLRYIADDATYYTKYKSYVKEFTENQFTVDKVNAMIDKNYNLIAPYVIGTEPEQKGYTYLSSSSDFTNAITALKAHIVTRNAAVKDFLK